jgi:hypothetical protein
LNAGELAFTGSGPLSPGPPLLENVGSGKFGTPWVRMQWANFSAACFWLAVGFGGGPLGVKKRAHAFSAATATGPLNVIPSTISGPPLTVRSMPLKPSPPGPFVGSGKFVTPCERMQLERPIGELVELGDSVVAPTAPPDPAPPHPAAATPQPAIAVSLKRMRLVVLRAVPSSIAKRCTP